MEGPPKPELPDGYDFDYINSDADILILVFLFANVSEDFWFIQY